MAHIGEGTADVLGCCRQLLALPKSERAATGRRSHAAFVQRYPKLFMCICQEDAFDVSMLEHMLRVLGDSESVDAASRTIEAELQQKYVAPVLERLGTPVPAPGDDAPAPAPANSGVSPA